MNRYVMPDKVEELVKSIGAKLNDCIRNAYGIDIDVVGISENKPNIKIPNCGFIFRYVKNN